MATPAAKKPFAASRHRLASGDSRLSENRHPNIIASSTPRRKPSPAKSSAAKLRAKPCKKPASKAAADLRLASPLSSSPSPSHSPGKEQRKSPRKVEKDLDYKRCDSGNGEDVERSSKMRKARRRMLEEAMSSVPEPGNGRVMYLAKTFERLLSMPKEAAEEGGGAGGCKVMNWALPGLQQQQQHPAKAEVTSSYSFDVSPEEEEEEFLLIDDPIYRDFI